MYWWLHAITFGCYPLLALWAFISLVSFDSSREDSSAYGCGAARGMNQNMFLLLITLLTF